MIKALRIADTLKANNRMPGTGLCKFDVTSCKVSFIRIDMLPLNGECSLS